MATWIIEGADRDTGADRTVSISAATQDDAVKEAASRGILVSKVTKADNPTQAAEAVAQAGQRPEYANILKGNRMLEFFGSLLSAFGWIGIAVAIFGLAFGIYWRLQDDLRAIAGLEAFVFGIVYAVPCFVGAVILRMYGALAIAIRDMARNSFG